MKSMRHFLAGILLIFVMLSMPGGISYLFAQVPANGTAFDGALIFSQLAFSESGLKVGPVLVEYHVFVPPTLWSNFKDPVPVYRFPDCANLRPVFDKNVIFDDSPAGTRDDPNRRIYDVRLKDGCAVQPTSEDEVFNNAVKIDDTGSYVNAPSVPSPVRATDEQLFPPAADTSGSPFSNAGWNGNVTSDADPYTHKRLFSRPPQMIAFTPTRHIGYSEGREMYYATYEASGMPEVEGSHFPGIRDVYFVHYSPALDKQSVANMVKGSPILPSRGGYSPYWEIKCVGGAGNYGPGCLGPTFQQIGQPLILSDALERLKAAGLLSTISKSPMGGVLCPIFAVDINNDGDFLDSGEIVNLGDDAIFYPPSALP